MVIIYFLLTSSVKEVSCIYLSVYCSLFLSVSVNDQTLLCDVIYKHFSRSEAWNRVPTWKLLEVSKSREISRSNLVIWALIKWELKAFWTGVLSLFQFRLKITYSRLLSQKHGSYMSKVYLMKAFSLRCDQSILNVLQMFQTWLHAD